ncbi:hypothetical protein EVAR_68624_1 [Eumeta japonica]|uniref:Uncharacterized protein n=1 Tax=Eumeta variegata TaxID=151549 RepID=A0A4C2A9B9_EUMVA|nr:hypothetical protein EVAR_68624_1 [Eumeta japonica]
MFLSNILATAIDLHQRRGLKTEVRISYPEQIEEWEPTYIHNEITITQVLVYFEYREQRVRTGRFNLQPFRASSERIGGCKGPLQKSDSVQGRRFNTRREARPGVKSKSRIEVTTVSGRP